MSVDRRAVAALVAGVLGGAAVGSRRRRRGGGDGGSDPAHAPGHQHLGPPPEVAEPATSAAPGAHDQPYVRTTHSDSQQRRFRR